VELRQPALAEQTFGREFSVPILLLGACGWAHRWPLDHGFVCYLVRGSILVVAAVLLMWYLEPGGPENGRALAWLGVCLGTPASWAETTSGGISHWSVALFGIDWLVRLPDNPPARSTRRDKRSA
jgi:hypothetical protein